MYCDTNSIIYTEDEHRKSIVTKYIGDSSGEWTDELGGESITVFTTMAPKGYGYIKSKGCHVGKVKG